MRSVILVLLSLAAFGHAALFDYTLDVNGDVNSAYLRVLCSHYEQDETFICSGAIPGVPADHRRNTSGFWTTCDRGSVKASPCTLAFYRTPNSIVLKSINITAYHNGQNARIRVHTSDPNNLDRIFNATSSWGNYMIDESVYANIESLDNLQITAETSSGFIVFDKLVMVFDDRAGNTTTQPPVTTTSGTGPTTTRTTTTSGPPTCVNGTQFQCVEDGRCLPINWMCDGEEDCSDGSDELPALCPCEPNEFECGDGRCAPAGSRCNGRPQCADWSDERMCPCPGPEDQYFRCSLNGEPGVGMCIDLEFLCDGAFDCPDLDDSDERNCTLQAQPRKTFGKFLLRN